MKQLCHASDVATVVFCIPHPAENNGVLKSLDVSNNDLGERAAAALGCALGVSGHCWQGKSAPYCWAGRWRRSCGGLLQTLPLGQQ